MLSIRLDGNGRILGVGNGDPSYLGADSPKEKDCRTFQIPAFNGLAQILVQSSNSASTLNLSCSSEELKTGSIAIEAK